MLLLNPHDLGKSFRSREACYTNFYFRYLFPSSIKFAASSALSNFSIMFFLQRQGNAVNSTHLTPILQSITQGESNSASRSSI